jgi:hypothetical protein
MQLIRLHHIVMRTLNDLFFFAFQVARQSLQRK